MNPDGHRLSTDMTRFGDPGLASAMGTVYLFVMLAVAITAIMLIWRPGSSTR